MAVVGGGNVAIDAARSALRLGAKNVFILYRRDKEDMPAYEEEILEAEREGIKIHTLVAPKRLIAENGKVTGVECVRMSLGKFDKSGRRTPEAITGSEFLIDADTVIAAVGQIPDLSYINGDGVAQSKSGTIAVDDYKTLATTRAGVFAAGDAVRGPATAVEAIGDGKNAARVIDKYLGGDGVLKDTFRERLVKFLVSYNEEEYQKERARVEAPMIPLSERYKNFKEVVLPYPSKSAVEEAKRCLHCYLRQEEQSTN